MTALSNVDWFITNKCNQGRFCQFCYAPWNAFGKEVDLPQAMRTIDRMGDLGVEVVTLCGGEPTQYPYLIQVLEALRSSGIKTVLYSNTVSVADFPWEKVLPLVYMLSLPLDAVHEEYATAMRGTHQTKSVLSVLDLVRSRPDMPMLKIGTVATRQNLGHLSDIMKVLLDKGIEGVWRIYQFSPFGLGERNQDKFLISDEEFYEAVNALKAVLREGNRLVVAERDREATIGYCRLMSPTGRMFLYQEAYLDLGVTSFDPVETILSAGIDNDKNTRQKDWHRLPVLP